MYAEMRQGQGVFQRYVQEHPHVGTLARQDKMPDWQWVQKRF